MLLLTLCACSDSPGGCSNRVERALHTDHVSPALPSGPGDAVDLLPAHSDLLVSFESAELIELSGSPWFAHLDRSMVTLSQTELLALCRHSAAALGHSMCTSGTRETLGLRADQPLLVARHAHHWLWVFESSLPWADPQTRPRTLSALDLSVTAVPEHTGLVELTHAGHEARAWMLHEQGFEVMILPVDRDLPADRGSALALASKIQTLSPRDRWRALPAHRTLYDQLSTRGELVIIGSSPQLAEQLSPDNALAGRQRDRLFSQIEHVGLALWRSSEDLNRLDGELQLSTRAGEAVFIRALEPSKAKLPEKIGALLSDRALGIVHTAVEPHSLLQMLRSALDGPQREELDEYLTYLKRDFLLDVESALLDNLTGHMLLVIYEVQPGKERDPSGPSIFGLDATHEVLFAPIQDRFALEQFLNAITQLSRSKLRRQREDGVIQYVWIEEGELLGAILLGDEAVAIVDSAVSVAHAMKQLTQPQPLSPEQSARYGAMLSSHRGFGLWMSPTAFSSRFDTEMGEVLEGMTQLSMTSYEQSPRPGSEGTLGAQVSVTLATEKFDEPVAGE